MTTNDEQRQRGRAIMDEVLGSAAVSWMRQNTDRFNADFRALTEAVCYGTIWDRPGLDRKTRALVAVAMLIPQGRPRELKGNINNALNCGATLEELREVMLQAVVYCGFPASNASFEIAGEVLRERGPL